MIPHPIGYLRQFFFKSISLFVSIITSYSIYFFFEKQKVDNIFKKSRTQSSASTLTTKAPVEFLIPMFRDLGSPKFLVLFIILVICFVFFYFVRELSCEKSFTLLFQNFFYRPFAYKILNIFQCIFLRYIPVQ